MAGGPPRGRIHEALLEIECPRCHRIIKARVAGAGRRTIRCSCGALLRISIDADVVDYTWALESLEEYRDWLVRTKRLSPETAKRYARDIERWIMTGRHPAYTAPFDYYTEYLIEEKGWHPVIARYALGR